MTSSLTCWGCLEFRFDDGALNKIFASFVEHHQASISSSAFQSRHTLFTSKFHDVARILSPYCRVFILHNPLENLRRKLNTGNSRRRAFRPKDILSAAENKIFISRDLRKPNLSTSEIFYATADISDPCSHFKLWISIHVESMENIICSHTFMTSS